jgi:hypothetical protein
MTSLGLHDISEGVSPSMLASGTRYFVDQHDNAQFVLRCHLHSAMR